MMEATQTMLLKPECDSEDPAICELTNRNEYIILKKSELKHEIDKLTKDLLTKSELSNEFEQLVRSISPALAYFSKQTKLLNILSSEPKLSY